MIEWLTRRNDREPSSADFPAESETETEVAPADDAPLAVTKSKSAAGVSQRTNIVFDVSDLIHYFHTARLPTGIQRVQIEVITNLIFTEGDSRSIIIAFFTKTSDNWLMMRPLFFNHICRLALIGGDTDADDWKRCLRELQQEIATARPLIFPLGAVLINLGTSWWLQNYFLHVRQAKARYAIRYIPYIHDCIPIVTPEHCTEGLTRDFVSWALGAFQHADHIMVNSCATATDVRRVANYLGHEIEAPAVITLDADYRNAADKLGVGRAGEDETSDLLERHDLCNGSGYVLCVGTVESRKNHALAFSAWLTLIKKHGLQKMPKLVCVGNRGWLNDVVYAKLEASKLLRGKVVMLSHIPDPDLAQLYKNCLFTLYPSSYEGWGLPVTESLCFGKVPVLSNSSSLPEAGGQFGEYFASGVEHELVTALERLIYDAPYRTKKEALIAREFAARSWKSIAEQITATVDCWVAHDLPAKTSEAVAKRGLWPFPAKLGAFHAIAENMHCDIYAGMRSNEVYRQGDAWWWPEPWGCWTKPKVARLAFTVSSTKGKTVMVYIGLRSVQDRASVASVVLRDLDSQTISLAPLNDRWIVFRIASPALEALRTEDGCVLFEFLISADCYADFAAKTDGLDPRKASVGVLGFMACEADDVDARMSLVESIALGAGSLQARPTASGSSEVFIA